jgi:rhodanese-related sulfurtransferase
MRKLILLLMLALMIMPVMAQDVAEGVAAPVIEALEAYNETIPPWGLVAAMDLGTALIERDIVLFDVREIPEYEESHIEGAFNVPIRTITQNLDLLPDLDAEIVVICKVGGRAQIATSSLRTLGYTNVSTLTDGMGGWTGEDFPVTTEPFFAEAGEAPEFDPDVFAAVDAYLTNLPEGFGLINAENTNIALVENPDIILVDVRTPEEVATGYIPGAEYFVEVGNFMFNMDMWPQDKDAAIIVYCKAGYRGGIATVMLNLMGYTNVRNLSGGIGAWNAAGLPLEGVPEATAPEFDLAAHAAAYLDSLPATFNAIQVADVEAAVTGENPPFVLDVRSLDEFVEGHIAGSVHVPLADLAKNLDLLPAQDAEIIVVCGTGHRSALGTAALNLLGYTNAQSMLRGLSFYTGETTTVATEPVVGTAPDVDPALFAAVDGWLSNMPAAYGTVRNDALNAELAENPDLFLLDVRTQGERDAGYIPGSVHVPFEQMLARQGELPAMDTAIVVISNPSHRSAIAMMLMQMLGYENVRSLAGGTGGWEAAGFPLVTD